MKNEYMEIKDGKEVFLNLGKGNIIIFIFVILSSSMSLFMEEINVFIFGVIYF